MLPGLVTFHTSLLENSIYSNEVFRLIEQYFRERVGVGFVDEAPVDFAEDLNGDIILNPNSVDPSLLKYHFFFRDSQKAKMREFFSS